MAVYENHDIVKKLLSAPGQFNDAKMRKDAAGEIKRLRSLLDENTEKKHDIGKTRRKGAAYLLMIGVSSALLAVALCHFVFAPGFLPGNGVLLVFLFIQGMISLVLNHFMADWLKGD